MFDRLKNRLKRHFLREDFITPVPEGYCRISYRRLIEVMGHLTPLSVPPVAKYPLQESAAELWGTMSTIINAIPCQKSEFTRMSAAEAYIAHVQLRILQSSREHTVDIEENILIDLLRRKDEFRNIALLCERYGCEANQPVMPHMRDRTNLVSLFDKNPDLPKMVAGRKNAPLIREFVNKLDLLGTLAPKPPAQAEPERFQRQHRPF